MSEARWVIHLPTTLTTLDAATKLVTALRDSLDHVTAIDFGDATLTEEDDQPAHYQVYCDRLLDDRSRCRRLDRHADPCSSRP
jgi:hypothetical protein